MKYLRGQGYDGAASISGKFNGVQACIRESYHSAIYIHCSAHNLNLSISYACSVASIRNAMGTVEYLFIPQYSKATIWVHKTLNLRKIILVLVKKKN